jgi:hypothetical protein
LGEVYIGPNSKIAIGEKLMFSADSPVLTPDSPVLC